MIDRHARCHFAEGLRYPASGRIHNDDFEWRYASRAACSADPAVRSSAKAARYLYDDLETHRLAGRYPLQRAALRKVARWILFLKGPLAYEWPVWTWRDYRSALRRPIYLRGAQA